MAPLMYNMAIIAAALWLSPTLGIYGLALGAVVGSLLHTHIRYGLPMQALLTIFGGVTLSSGQNGLRKRMDSRKALPG